MGKTKRKGGLTGVSRFVFETMGSTSETSSPTVALTPQKTPEDATDDPIRPSKRRKANDGTSLCEADSDALDSKYVKRYDASGLVPHYTHISEVPEHLHKYFAQRERFFSLYSTPPGCLLDEEGWYSVTPELLADQIAERCRCDTILDAFCGVGGNAIAFAKTCQRVIALDTSPTRLALARHNAQIYGVADRIEFILADYISFAKAFTSHNKNSLNKNKDNDGSETTEQVSQSTRKIDVVFLSPPWGGPSYLSGGSSDNIAAQGNAPEPDVEVEPEHPSYSLSSIQPIHGAFLFDLTREITHNVAYYLPRNTRLDEISGLLSEERQRTMASRSSGDGKSDSGHDTGEKVEVEEEWMGNKLKALTCYFGGLVVGQEDLF